tara:strand:- start:816 stop:1061 length:246 start_codon:yes stop_codon:yes gene_type:complete
VFKATVTRVSEYTLYVDAEDIEFVEDIAMLRTKKYPEEWVDIDHIVDVEQVDHEALDKNISFGMNQREDNLDTGGYGKQQI